MNSEDVQIAILINLFAYKETQKVWNISSKMPINVLLSLIKYYISQSVSQTRNIYL